MASIDELPLKYRLFTRTYSWRKIDPVPFTPLRKPLAESRVGLVTSAGLSMPDDAPFDSSIKGGDWSLRVIADDADLGSLFESQKSDAWDHGALESDRNIALPIDRLHELAGERRIGSVNRRHLSFMGSLTAPGRLIQQSAPEAAELFLADQVDVALLVPV